MNKYTKSIIDAEKHYSYKVQYHSWKHASDVLNDVTTLAKMNNITKEKRDILQLAAAWHDAGYHEKTGHQTKEDYSIELFRNNALSYKIKQEVVNEVSKIIEATKIGHVFTHETRAEEAIMHMADIWNITYSDYEFIQISSKLHEEKGVSYQKHLSDSIAWLKTEENKTNSINSKIVGKSTLLESIRSKQQLLKDKISLSDI